VNGPTALILVDLQNDFLPGGALAVAGANEVIAVANAEAPNHDFVVATQDFHPVAHSSFAPTGPWPAHCVQGTRGADFAPGLVMGGVTVFPKGTDPAFDSYSGFADEGGKGTGLAPWLRARGVEDLTIMGLATDYCVLASVLDACRLGFKVTVVLAGCRGVGLKSEDVPNALQAMQDAGARVLVADGA
jgi:nicotinamidase/pyrazinamidase